MCTYVCVCTACTCPCVRAHLLVTHMNRCTRTCTRVLCVYVCVPTYPPNHPPSPPPLPPTLPPPTPTGPHPDDGARGAGVRRDARQRRAAPPRQPPRYRGSRDAPPRAAERPGFLSFSLSPSLSLSLSLHLHMHDMYI